MEKMGRAIANQKLLQEREEIVGLSNGAILYGGLQYLAGAYTSTHDKILEEDLLILEEPLIPAEAQNIGSQHCTKGYHIKPAEHNLAAPINTVNHPLNFVHSPLPPLAPPQSTHTRRPPMRKGTASYRDNHIFTERKRRQDMTLLFDKLRSVLPNMQQDDLKVDRCTIVGHVIEYVQELDKKVQALEKVKAELLMQAEGDVKSEEASTEQQPRDSGMPLSYPAFTSVSVRLCGPTDIFITLNCPKQRGLWPNLLALLQDTLHLHVHNFALSSTPLFCSHSIYAKVISNTNDELCCDKIQKILSNFIVAHKIML